MRNMIIAAISAIAVLGAAAYPAPVEAAPQNVASKSKYKNDKSFNQRGNTAARSGKLGRCPFYTMRTGLPCPWTMSVRR
jgi:hypothetical protein